MLFRSMFPDTPSAFTPNLLVGFGFGASLVALFAQVGGGIYTKATDVLTLTQTLTQTLTRWVAASTPRLPTWGQT